MKKLLSIVLCVSMIFSMSAFAMANEGQVVISDDVVIDDGATGEEVTCSCEAAEGEAHLEGCGLYVAPDEPGDEPEGEVEAPSVDILMCTCDAAEGEPHADSCVLYEAPVEAVVCEECGMSDAHAETCSQHTEIVSLYEKLAATKTLLEFRGILLDEENREASYALDETEIRVLTIHLENLYGFLDEPTEDDTYYYEELLDTLSFLPAMGGSEIRSYAEDGPADVGGLNLEKNAYATDDGYKISIEAYTTGEVIHNTTGNKVDVQTDGHR